MAFVLIQTSADTIGPINNFGTAQTINTWTGAVNFTVGNLVIVKISHYAGTASDTLSCTINGLAATKFERQNPTNTVNSVIIFYAVVTTGGARNVVLTPSAGADHYISVDIEEYSFSGTLTLVGTETGADGNSTGPTVNTHASSASGDLAVGAHVIADVGSRTVVSTAPGTPTLGFNEGDSNTNQAGAGASKILTAGGAQAFTWSFTAGGASNWSVMTAVFNQSGGGAPADIAPAKRSTVEREAPVEESRIRRRMNVVSLVAIAAASGPLTERVTISHDVPVEERRNVRPRWVLPSGAVVGDPIPSARSSVEFPERAEEPRPTLRRQTLLSGAVVLDPVPFARSPVEFPERAEEPRPVSLRRLPESVDDPVFLLWATFEEAREEARPRRKPVALSSGAAPSNEPPPALERLLHAERREEPLARLRQRLPESVDQPLTERPRQVGDDLAIEPVLRLPRSHLLSEQVAADQPPPERHRQVVDALPEEARIRVLLRLPETGAPPAEQLPPALDRQPVDIAIEESRIRLRQRLPESVDVPPPARGRQVGDALPEEAHPRLLWRLPESVDQPLLGRGRQVIDVATEEEPHPRLLLRLPESVDAPPVLRARQSVDVAPEEPRPRRSLKFPDPVVVPPGDLPPAPRWRTTYDAPLEDLKSARSRFVLPSGALVIVDHPPARWRTAAERPHEETRISRRLLFPESVDQPALVRWRAVVDSTVEEPRIARKLRLPESVDLPSFVRARQVIDSLQPEHRPTLESSTAPWAVVLVDDQPLALRRLLPEVQVVEWRPRLPRLLPDSVDVPLPTLRRGLPSESREEVRPEAVRLVYVETPAVDFIAKRWRTVFEPSVEERSLRRRLKLPDFIPPPPGDEIPPKRWALVSFSHPFELLPLPRRLTFVVESGPLPPVVAVSVDVSVSVSRRYTATAWVSPRFDLRLP